MAFRQPTNPRQYQPWHGWLFGVVLVTAVALGIAQKLDRDEPPTADVPAVGWEDVQETDTPNVDDALPEEAEDVPVEEPVVAEPVDTPPASGRDDDDALPATFNLAVPFTSQAPNGVWDPLHEDACEEASIYMVDQYFAGAGNVKIDPAIADPVLVDMVNMAQSELGHGLSITAEQVVELVDAYYDGYTAEIIEDPSINDIKQFLVDGYPVIVPAAGRELGNPFFTGEGPLYHMLVIRGYDESRFITNDPGTRHGQNYAYLYSVLMSAMGDWNDGDPANGAERVIILKPE